MQMDCLKLLLLQVFKCLKLGTKGEINLALICQFILTKHDKVIQLLIDTSRLPEAAFYARTYCPSQISRVVDLWKQSLVKAGKTQMAEAIADPGTHEDLFQDYQISLDMEKVFSGIKNAGMPPSAAYSAYSAFDNVDVIGGTRVY
jgi:coatomer subunit beta'